MAEATLRPTSNLAVLIKLASYVGDGHSHLVSGGGFELSHAFLNLNIP